MPTQQSLRCRTRRAATQASHTIARASPREDLVHGEVATTRPRGTHKWTRPRRAMHTRPRRAMHARPPRTSPPERLSRLYVLLLHAAAGSLSEEDVRAWSLHPCLGNRWAALVSAMRHAPAADPQGVARLLSAVADAEAHEGRRPVAAADIDIVNVLTAFPDSVLPLPAAVALSASSDGYITAATQSA